MEITKDTKSTNKNMIRFNTANGVDISSIVPFTEPTKVRIKNKNKWPYGSKV